MVSSKELKIIKNKLNMCEFSLSIKKYDDALDYFNKADKRIKFASLKIKDVDSEKVNVYLSLLRLRNRLYNKLKDEKLEKEIKKQECLLIRQVESCEECSRNNSEFCRIVLMEKGRI